MDCENFKSDKKNTTDALIAVYGCVMCMEILTLKYEINDTHHSSFISPVKNKNAYKVNNIHSKKYSCKRL